METSEIIKKKQNNRQKAKNFEFLRLIEDIRDFLIKILPKDDLLYGKKLTDKKLSIYLGQEENYIKYLNKNITRNSCYQIFTGS